LTGNEQPYSIAQAFASYLITTSPKKTASSQKSDKRLLAIAQYFFEKVLGQSVMSEIGVESLEQFEIWASEPQKCGEISKEAWSPSSILRHGKTIKTIFRKAFLTGRIQRDPTALWKLQNADPLERRRPMTDEEFEKLLSIAPDWYKPILRILAATGARPSSIARLKWKDVDFSSGTLYLTTRKGGRNREKRNPFPITEEVDEIFANRKSQIANHDSNDFVFLKNNSGVSGPLISITGHRLIQEAGISGVVLYGLRHKFATDLLRAGTSTELARRLLGHSSERMLKEYSSHLGIESLENAVTSMRKKK
jgi:integrase